MGDREVAPAFWMFKVIVNALPALVRQTQKSKRTNALASKPLVVPDALPIRPLC
jgi:hypothetical protein